MRACNCARASPLQSRTRVGCDLLRISMILGLKVFQSTHPRGVRLNGKPSAREVKMVSIHAPAWGATPSWSRAGRCPASFNPRTRVGCDAFRQVGTKSLTGFNPRTRVGCDCGCWCGPTASSRFNPRTRVGCDLPALAPFSFIVRFQSTHPRGVRLQHIGQQEVYTKVSIHAPAWGATC